MIVDGTRSSMLVEHPHGDALPAAPRYSAARCRVTVGSW